jgi:hypothetical protein
MWSGKGPVEESKNGIDKYLFVGLNELREEAAPKQKEY